MEDKISQLEAEFEKLGRTLTKIEKAIQKSGNVEEAEIDISDLTFAVDHITRSQKEMGQIRVRQRMMVVLQFVTIFFFVAMHTSYSPLGMVPFDLVSASILTVMAVTLGISIQKYLSFISALLVEREVLADLTEILEVKKKSFER